MAKRGNQGTKVPSSGSSFSVPSDIAVLLPQSKQIIDAMRKEHRALGRHLKPGAKQAPKTTKWE